MRIPETTSPLRRNVTTGLERASAAAGTNGAVPGANPFKSMGVKAASFDPAGAGTNGVNDSDMG
jgi:hypothetical protein